MSTPEHHSNVPVHVYQNNQTTPTAPVRSATMHGVIALVLCGLAVVLAPVLLLIPYVGFLPALIAGAGIVVTWSGLRGSTRGTGIAITGLIISVVLFALLAGVATFWNVVIADPAIRDYGELHDVIDYIKSLIFG